MNDVLYPECGDCGARDGIHKAIVGPKDSDDMHDVERLELACGHVLVDPDMRLEDGVVELLRLQHPEYIEVRRPA